MVSMAEMARRRAARVEQVREGQRVAERYYGSPPTNIAEMFNPLMDGSDTQPQLRPEGPILNALGENVGPIMEDPAAHLEGQHQQQQPPPELNPQL